LIQEAGEEMRQLRLLRHTFGLTRRFAEPYRRAVELSLRRFRYRLPPASLADAKKKAEREPDMVSTR
jgi:hypothetical protein